MSTTTVYAVRRIAWDGGYSQPFRGSFSGQGSYGDDSVGPRHVPVGVFTTERAANDDAHRRNADARAGVSPFWFEGAWDMLTDLTLKEAAARFARQGFKLPPPKHPEDDSARLWRTCATWREWWDRESVNWNEEQLADAWAVFNKLRFYDVVEIEMED